MRDAYPALEKSVFIVTYGRSGSTLVQNMLNALPGACVRGENENLLAPLARSWDMLRHSEQGANLRAHGTPSTSANPWFGFEDVAPEAYGAALARAFMETVLRPAPDTRIAGFKEIRWHNDPVLFPVMLDFLRKFFPKAHILFNTRNHDQVCRSGWWKHMREEKVRRTLEEAEALYDAYAARHPGACLSLHYDEYVKGPEAWRPLFSFLAEPYDENLVNAVLNRRLTHLGNV